MNACYILEVCFGIILQIAGEMSNGITYEDDDKCFDKIDARIFQNCYEVVTIEWGNLFLVKECLVESAITSVKCI